MRLIHLLTLLTLTWSDPLHTFSSDSPLLNIFLSRLFLLTETIFTADNFPTQSVTDSFYLKNISAEYFSCKNCTFFLALLPLQFISTLVFSLQSIFPLQIIFSILSVTVSFYLWNILRYKLFPWQINTQFQVFLLTHYFSCRVFSIRRIFRANYSFFRNITSCLISEFIFRVFFYQNIMFSQIMIYNINFWLHWSFDVTSNFLLQHVSHKIVFFLQIIFLSGCSSLRGTSSCTVLYFWVITSPISSIYCSWFFSW